MFHSTAEKPRNNWPSVIRAALTTASGKKAETGSEARQVPTGSTFLCAQACPLPFPAPSLPWEALWVLPYLTWPLCEGFITLIIYLPEKTVSFFVFSRSCVASRGWFLLLLGPHLHPHPHGLSELLSGPTVVNISSHPRSGF